MEKSTSQKIRLGFFVIIGLVLFVLAIYFIGDKQKMFGGTSNLKAEFNNVNGLQLGNNVRFSGINVGTVRSIDMINDTLIRVNMIIEKTVFPHIKKDAKASISSDGLVGNMIINIIPGTDTQPAVQAGDILKSVNRIRTDDVLKTFSTTNDNLAELSLNLLKVTKQISEGKGTVGLLINDTVMANDLKKTIYYLKLTGKGASETVADLNSTLSSLNKKDNVLGIIKDTVVANKIKKIIANLDRSTHKIDKVVQNLNATIVNVKDGKGAINYLSNNPKLVQKMDSTMTNINEASYRLNENLEALKHNFLFRGYFKKLEKENNKKENTNSKH